MENMIKEDISRYNSVFEQNDKNSFELCKEILERCKNFMNLGFGTQEHYLGILRKSKDLRFKYNTIYRIYKTGKIFPEILDLGTYQNRPPRRPFSVYDMIVNSSLNDEQRKELKNISEEERLTVREVKRRIRRYIGNPIIVDEKTVPFFCNSSEGLVYETFKIFRSMKCNKGDEVTVNIKVKRINQKGGN